MVLKKGNGILQFVLMPFQITFKIVPSLQVKVLFLYLVTSWFAGHMNETEAANLLSDQSPGYFLIRISSSRAHEGVFVLAVKTRDNGVVQIQIEVSRVRTFPFLHHFYEENLM